MDDELEDRWVHANDPESVEAAARDIGAHFMQTGMMPHTLGLAKVVTDEGAFCVITVNMREAVGLSAHGTRQLAANLLAIADELDDGNYT